MGGTVHGVVNKTTPRYSSSAVAANVANVFASFAQFFDHLSTPAGGSIMTRIASNYGDGGSGFDYVGGAAPVGIGASSKLLGVWEMNTSTLRPGGGSALGKVYFMLVASPGSNATAYFNNWSLFVNTDQYGQGKVGLQIAFREDGLSPWTGGVANLGGDTPGNPPWTDGGVSTLHLILPRCCNPGGAYGGSMDNMAELGRIYFGDLDITEGYFHGFADDDNIAVFFTSSDGWNVSDDPRDFAAFYFGLGELQPNCGADPYFCYSWVDVALGFSRGSTYGDTAGSADNQGGLKPPGTTVGGLIVSTPFYGLDQNRSPNPYSVGGLVSEEQGTQIISWDAWLGYGHEPGGSDFWRIIYGVPNEALDATNKRIALGNTSLLNEKITMPWPDTIGEAPGATRTNDGVKF